MQIFGAESRTRVVVADASYLQVAAVLLAHVVGEVEGGDAALLEVVGARTWLEGADVDVVLSGSVGGGEGGHTAVRVCFVRHELRVPEAEEAEGRFDRLVSVEGVRVEVGVVDSDVGAAAALPWVVWVKPSEGGSQVGDKAQSLDVSLHEKAGLGNGVVPGVFDEECLLAGCAQDGVAKAELLFVRLHCLWDGEDDTMGRLSEPDDLSWVAVPGSWGEA